MGYATGNSDTLSHISQMSLDPPFKTPLPCVFMKLQNLAASASCNMFTRPGAGSHWAGAGGPLLQVSQSDQLQNVTSLGHTCSHWSFLRPSFAFMWLCSNPDYSQNCTKHDDVRLKRRRWVPTGKGPGVRLLQETSSDEVFCHLPLELPRAPAWPACWKVKVRWSMLKSTSWIMILVISSLVYPGTCMYGT